MVQRITDGSSITLQVTTDGNGMCVAAPEAATSPDLLRLSDEPSNTILAPQDTRPVIPKTKGVRTSSATFPSLGNMDTDAMKIFVRSVATPSPPLQHLVLPSKPRNLLWSFQDCSGMSAWEWLFSSRLDVYFEDILGYESLVTLIAGSTACTN